MQARDPYGGVCLPGMRRAGRGRASDFQHSGRSLQGVNLPGLSANWRPRPSHTGGRMQARRKARRPQDAAAAGAQLLFWHRNDSISLHGSAMRRAHGGCAASRRVISRPVQGARRPWQWQRHRCGNGDAAECRKRGMQVGGRRRQSPPAPSCWGLAPAGPHPPPKSREPAARRRPESPTQLGAARRHLQGAE